MGHQLRAVSPGLDRPQRRRHHLPEHGGAAVYSFDPDRTKGTPGQELRYPAVAGHPGDMCPPVIDPACAARGMAPRQTLGRPFRPRGPCCRLRRGAGHPRTPGRAPPRQAQRSSVPEWTLGSDDCGLGPARSRRCWRRRRERRTPSAGVPANGHPPLRPCSRRGAHRGGRIRNRRLPAISSRTVAAGPTCGARVTAVRRGFRCLKPGGEPGPYRSFCRASPAPGACLSSLACWPVYRTCREECVSVRIANPLQSGIPHPSS